MKLRDYGINHPKLLVILRDILRDNGALLDSVRVRCVAVGESPERRNALAIIQAFPRDARPPEAETIQYDGVMLLEHWLPISDLERYIESVQSDKTLRVRGSEVGLGETSLNWDYEYQSGGNGYSPFPGFLFQTGASRVALQLYEPLLSFTEPFYADIYDAIGEWLGVTPYHGNSDSRNGGLLVFIPQCRAYFSEMGRADGEARIRVQRRDERLGSLKIKGLWERSTERHRIDLPVGKKPVAFQLPEDSESLQIYLMGSDGTIFDFHKESVYWSTRQTRLITGSGARGTSPPLEESLKQGEGQTIEFKPFIAVGDPKMNEVLETVIAFANTSGGTIFFGVTNHCIVEGVERDIQREAKKENIPEGEALVRYIGQINQFIAGRLTKSPRVEIEPLTHSGHTVLAINIGEGESKPYWDSQSKDIFVRHGASNIKPDPERELPQLYNKSDWFRRF